MTDRFGAMTDHELEGSLGAIGRRLDWPATPDVAPAVGETIRAFETSPSLSAPRLWLPSRRRTLLVIAAALLTLAGAAIAARLVIELGAIAVEVLPGSPASLPTNVAARGALGREVTLGEANEIAGFAPALPLILGAPDRAWVDEAVIEPGSARLARRIVTAWSPTSEIPAIPGTGRGAVLMQFEGHWEVAAKLLFGETDLFGIAFVDGRQAFWTLGEHELVLVSGQRSVRYVVTGTVLIWQEAGFTFRLETALPKAGAVRIAESVTPVAE